jgi:hypothetical protein
MPTPKDTIAKLAKAKASKEGAMGIEIKLSDEAKNELVAHCESWVKDMLTANILTMEVKTSELVLSCVVPGSPPVSASEKVHLQTGVLTLLSQKKLGTVSKTHLGKMITDAAKSVVSKITGNLGASQKEEVLSHAVSMMNKDEMEALLEKTFGALKDEKLGALPPEEFWGTAKAWNKNEVLNAVFGESESEPVTSATPVVSPDTELPKKKVTTKSKAQPAPKVEVPATGKYPEANVTDPAVHLISAVRMYQPVHGTSGGSRYFMIARNKDVAVAVRILGSKLSFRIEAHNFDSWAPKFQHIGLAISDSSHASIHLDVPDASMARRTIGALLLDLGVEFDTPTPVINKILNHGA